MHNIQLEQELCVHVGCADFVSFNPFGRKQQKYSTFLKSYGSELQDASFSRDGWSF